MNRLLSFLLFLTCLLLSGTPLPAMSETTSSSKPVILRAALNNPKISGQYQGILIFKKLVEERTGGTVIVEVIVDGALGDEEQLAEGMQQGTVDFTIHSSAKYANSVPEMDIYSPPYTFNNWDHMKAVMASAVNDKLVQIVMERRGDHFVGVYTEGLRNVFTRKELRQLDDLKGLRIRTMTGPSELGAWRALGANPTPTGYLELYSALQTGRVDGAENTMTALIGMRFHETSKYVLRTAHNYMAMPAILSGKFIKKLPKDIGNVVIQAAKDSAKEQLDWAIEFDQKNEQVLTEQHGVKVTELSKADYELAVSICKSLHVENARRIGMEKEQQMIADLGKKY